MNPTTVDPHRPRHPARGLPPPARGRGRAAFLLESVEQGRLGRHSLRRLRLAARRPSRRRRRCGEPVVGYLAYDHVAKLEPTVPLPDRGPRPAREPLRRRRHARPLRPRARRRRGALRRSGRHRAPARRPAAAARERHRRPAGTIRRYPSRHDYERGVERAKEHIRAGDAFQIVLSQRAERPTSASALELYRALRRVNPSPYLFLLELDGSRSSARRPRRSSSARAGARALNPIAGTTQPRRGRRRAAARLREGPRRARDARRPRPQRPLARLPCPAPCRSSASSSPSGSRTSRTSSPRSPASCATA